MPTTSNFGWTTPADTDLVKDGALAIRTLGNGIDTSMAQLKGGTTGQVLSKTSGTDMAFTWTTPQVGDITAVNAGTGISGGGTSGDVTITNSMATTIDAKGDLIAGTANDTFARLAVGNNGETLVADSSTSTGLRWTAGNPQGNPVLNSAFQVWQRGTSFAYTGSVAYSADRWCAYNNGTSMTISRQTTSDTTNLPFIQYCARVQRNNAATNTNVNFFLQSIESINSIPYAGKTVTFSFYARRGANYSSTSNLLNAFLYSGTGTDQNWISAWTGQALVAGDSVTLTTTWQRFTLTGTVSSSATQLAIVFNNTPTGTAGAADFFEVTGVQIDVGSVALPFRTYAATLAGELAACQRYYYRFGGDQTTQPYGIGYGTLSTQALITITHPVPMRVAPTLTDYNLLWLVDHATTTNVTSLAIPSNWSGKNCTAVNAAVASGLTVNRPYNLIGQGTLSSFIGFSAEL